MENPYVSLIVCTYNGVANGIEACITSIGNLQHPLDLLELTIVNDGSKDETETLVNDQIPVLKRKGLKLIQLVNPPGNGLGLYGSKRRAMQESKERGFPAKVIAVTDDDCEVYPDWLNRMVPHFEDPNVGSVGGFIGSKNLGTPLERFAADTRNNVLCNSLIKHWAHGANCTYSNEGLQRIGGFDPHTVSGGDAQVNFELQRVGFIHKHEPDARVNHQHRTSVDGLEKQFLKYGGGDFNLLQNYGQARFTPQEMTDLFLSATQNPVQRPGEDDEVFGLRPGYDQLKSSSWLSGYAKAELASKA